MSIFDVFDEIQRDTLRLERARKQLEADPENRALLVAASAIKKRIDQARSRARAEASANQIDLVQYRIENISEKYPVAAVGDSVSSFQKGFTALYDLVVNGKKERARYSGEIEAQSELFVGYTYPGSLGFVFFVESDRSLFFDKFDVAVAAFRDFLTISNTDDALECSRTIGLAATSRMYNWVDANARRGIAVDYQWRLSSGSMHGEYIERERFQSLKEIFDQASDTMTDVIEVSGTLVGIDTDRLTFHLVAPSGETYRGDASENVRSGEYLVPHRYLARIQVQSTIVPATAERKETYMLLGLK